MDADRFRTDPSDAQQLVIGDHQSGSSGSDFSQPEAVVKSSLHNNESVSNSRRKFEKTDDQQPSNVTNSMNARRGWELRSAAHNSYARETISKLNRIAQTSADRMMPERQKILEPTTDYSSRKQSTGTLQSNENRHADSENFNDDDSKSNDVEIAQNCSDPKNDWKSQSDDDVYSGKSWDLRSALRRGSARDTIEKFNKVAEINQQKLDKNPFSATYSVRQYDKNAVDYGRPARGSKTEARGIKAGVYIMREILFLCEVINEHASGEPPDRIIKFGPLFYIYANYSDKLVGMLIRARKYNLVDFDGEMLYQRQDDEKIIRLLKPINEIRKIATSSGDPKNCIAIQK